MLVEAAVLDGQGGGHDPGRERRETPVAELPVHALFAHLAQEAPVAVAQEEGRLRGHEPRAPEGEEHEGRRRGHDRQARDPNDRAPLDGEPHRSIFTRAPTAEPTTAPSYIISVLAAGCVKVPSVVARARKWKS